MPPRVFGPLGPKTLRGQYFFLGSSQNAGPGQGSGVFFSPIFLFQFLGSSQNAGPGSECLFFSKFLV